MKKAIIDRFVPLSLRHRLAGNTITDWYAWLLDGRRNDEIESPPEHYKLLNSDGASESLKILDFIKHGEKVIPAERGIAFLWKNGEYLHVCGVFEGTEKKNKKDWTTGDVMEFFFQAHDSDDYYELHLTPENVIYELKLPKADKSVKMPESQFYKSGFVCNAERFQYRNPKLSGWYGHMKIPLKGIGITDGNPEKSRFSVCRYNYNRNWEEPELSSTSYYPEGGFLQSKYWHEIILASRT